MKTIKIRPAYFKALGIIARDEKTTTTKIVHKLINDYLLREHGYHGLIINGKYNDGEI